MELFEQIISGAAMLVIAAGVIAGIVQWIPRRRKRVSVRVILERHLKPISLDRISTTGRKFPVHIRADLQWAIDEFLRGVTVSSFLGVRGSQRFEVLDFTTLLNEQIGSSAITGPPQYDQIDIGAEEPVQVLQSGLWLLEHAALGLRSCTRRRSSSAGVVSNSAFNYKLPLPTAILARISRVSFSNKLRLQCRKRDAIAERSCRWSRKNPIWAMRAALKYTASVNSTAIKLFCPRRHLNCARSVKSTDPSLFQRDGPEPQAPGLRHLSLGDRPLIVPHIASRNYSSFVPKPQTFSTGRTVYSDDISQSKLAAAHEIRSEAIFNYESICTSPTATRPQPKAVAIPLEAYYIYRCIGALSDIYRLTTLLPRLYPAASG